MKKIAVFASGSGTNAEKIIAYLKSSSSSKIRDEKTNQSAVSLIVCNKPGAGVVQIAAENNIPVLLIEKEKFFSEASYIIELKMAGVEFIVLAGFLWKIPPAIIKAYPKKIINLHPALLPGYGGKGMYGQFVHEAVLANKEKESGITIHYVDELYDHGAVIFQARCPVLANDTPASLAERVQQLEHTHYPKLIAEIVNQ